MDMFFNLSFTERHALYTLAKVNGYKIKSGRLEKTKQFKSQTINKTLNNKAFDKLTKNQSYINALFDTCLKGSHISSNVVIIFNSLMNNPNRRNEINKIFIKQVARNPKLVRNILQNKQDIIKDEKLKKSLLENYNAGLKSKIANNSLTKQDIEFITNIDKSEISEITVTLAGIATEQLKYSLKANPNMQELYNISNDNYTKQSQSLVEENLKKASWFKILPENMKKDILDATYGQHESKLAAKDAEIEKLKEVQKSSEKQTIAQKESELEKREQIADMKEKFQEREKILIEREEKLQQMERLLQEKNKKLDQREQELMTKEQELSEKENSSQVTTPTMNQSTQKLLDEANQIVEQYQQNLVEPETQLNEDSITDKYSEAVNAINQDANLTPEQKEAERQRLYEEYDNELEKLETTTSFHR